MGNGLTHSVKLTRGKKVKSSYPIEFENGEAYQNFTVINANKGIFFTDNGDLVRISRKVKWQETAHCQGGMY